MAMKSFDNNHLDKWKFMRILVDLQSPNTMLCWTTITVVFVPQVEILLRSCKILQESCKILIKIKILIRSCLTFKILKNLSKNLVRS